MRTLVTLQLRLSVIKKRSPANAILDSENVIQQDDLEAQPDRPTGNDSGVILLTPRN